VFVVSEAKGTWGTAKAVPGIAALNKGGVAHVYSVSCGSAGSCTAAGYYTGAASVEAFVADEVKGTWGAAREVAGSLNTDGLADIGSVSCASAGNCSAGGFYTVLDSAEDNAYSQAFIVSETDGVWGIPAEVPGIETLDKGGGAEITSVSCRSAGNCSAGGYYTSSSGNQQAFVVSKSKGIWGTPKEVAGALNKGRSGARRGLQG
jgi:hypothetical protein